MSARRAATQFVELLRPAIDGRVRAAEPDAAEVVDDSAAAGEENALLAERRERRADGEELPGEAPAGCDTSTIGTSASGNAMRSGTQRPWSHPRDGSSADGIPAIRSRSATSFGERAGRPGRGTGSDTSRRETPRSRR